MMARSKARARGREQKTEQGLQLGSGLLLLSSWARRQDSPEIKIELLPPLSPPSPSLPFLLASPAHPCPCQHQNYHHNEVAVFFFNIFFAPTFLSAASVRPHCASVELVHEKLIDLAGVRNLLLLKVPASDSGYSTRREKKLH